MAYINIDKTVEKILDNYRRMCEKRLAQERKRIASKKYQNLRDKEFDLDMLERARKSFEFLSVVVNDPKKYLYTGKGIFHKEVPQDIVDAIYKTDTANKEDTKSKQAAVVSSGKSVYDMMEGLITNVYDPNRIFVRLSESLSYHAMTGRKEVWGYITDGVIDSEAEKILKINKYMALVDANDFVKTFKGLMPEQFFAISMYDKRQK